MTAFLKTFLKCAGLAEVSTVGIFHGDKMLLGKRRDNGKWTNPGGHLDPGEDAKAGAKRELFEEAGIELELSRFKHLRTEKVTTPTGKQLIIHAYRCDAPEARSSMKNDPDQEVHRWHWVDISKGLPKEIAENLHSPKNTLLKALGLQDQDHETLVKAAFWQAFAKTAEKQINEKELAYLYANHEARETPAQEKRETPKEQALEKKIGIEPPLEKKAWDAKRALREMYKRKFGLDYWAKVKKSG